MKLLELIPLNYEHIYNTMKYFELEDLSMWQIVLQNFTNPNIIGSWANTVNEHINKANNISKTDNINKIDELTFNLNKNLDSSIGIKLSEKYAKNKNPLLFIPA